MRAKKGCRRGRRIVIRQVPGGKVAQTRSDRRGRYKVAASVGSGRYQAVAKRKVLRKQDRRILCKAGKSRRIRVS